MTSPKKHPLQPSITKEEIDGMIEFIGRHGNRNPWVKEYESVERSQQQEKAASSKDCCAKPS
jgi:hypothetical protein